MLRGSISFGTALPAAVVFAMVLILLGCDGSSGGRASDCDGDCFPSLVASGDVDQSSVVLWARTSFTGSVQFEYGRDPDFDAPADGVRSVSVSDVNVPAWADIGGLNAGTQYHYRACRGRCSPDIAPEDEARGSFRTPHADGSHGLRFGVSSCFKETFRPYAAIENLPDRNLDFFVALGDTVYADRAGSVGDFRNNYKKVFGKIKSQADNMFALARASTPFFLTIDDHEVRNDFAGGAKPRPQDECTSEREELGLCNSACNSQVECCDEGDANCAHDFYNETDVFKNSMQAFHEYNPIRTETYGPNLAPRMRGKPKLYRYRTFGQDAALFVLDARSFRDSPMPGAGGFVEKAAHDSRRTMLGPAQRDELLADLEAAQDAGIVWKFVMIPEPIQNVGQIPPPRDRFAGYAHERAVLLHFIERRCIDNVVFVSGDIHMNIVNNLSYKRAYADVQRFSAAWDISTGPVGHESASSLVTQEPAFSAALVSRLFASLLPRPGLDLDPYITQQEWNSIPYELTHEGDGTPWSTANKFSWSEFEVDATTQTLQVTTRAVDYYEPGSDGGDDHFILNRFEIEPRSEEARRTCVRNNAPLPPLEPCYSDIECDSGVCVQECPQGQCLPGLCCVPPLCTQQCGDGRCEGTESCGDENITSSSPTLEFHECRSDCERCENGTFCLEDGDCDSGICNVSFCVGANSLRAGTPCDTNDACISGTCRGFVCAQECGDGSCDGTEKCGDGHSIVECQDDCGLCPMGSACLQNSDCRGGECALLVCADCTPACNAACNATFEQCASGCESGPVCGPACDACKEICRETRDVCRDACDVACS